MQSSEEIRDFLGLVGQRLGPYVVLEAASIGGFAVVYRGEHETLHNEVAIKVLTPEVAPAATRETLEQLFLREAQILSQLRSEDILRAHDHGRAMCPKDGRERPYMVVDFLRGRTLADEVDARRAKKQPFTLLEVVELLEPIARALAATHAAGVVHRDVNPRNIFLEERADGMLSAKLIDFGFAKTVTQTVSALNVQRVNATLMARSPDYSAPEHYDREKYGELSEMTDLYTLALVMVEALTLSSPLRGATPEALFRCTANPEERPTPRTHGAEISDEAEALFLRALAVDQLERPTSVLDWYEELKEVATPKTEPPPPLEEQSAAAEPEPAALPAPTPPEPEPEPEPEAETLPVGRPWARRIGILLVSLIFLGGAAAAAARFVAWPLACPPGRGDCNARALDGCETELSSSSAHCGGCGKACPTAEALVECVDSRCQVQSCSEKNHRDCNHDATDGCETDLTSDLANCGECGIGCVSTGAKRVLCVAGTCKVACDRQHADCDGKPETGCETATSNDPANCGRCGFACDGTTCDDGYCMPKELAKVKKAEHLAVAAGKVYFYDPDDKAIYLVVAGGVPERIADHVDNIVSLVAGSDVVVWSSEKPGAVYAFSPGGAAPPKRVAGPLPKTSPLVVDVSGSFVSWSTRVVTPGTVTPLGKPNAVVTEPLDAKLLSETITPNGCQSAVAAFAGDGKQQICCIPAGPIASLDCSNGECSLHRYSVKCPERLSLDAGYLYWTQDVRVVALDRQSGEPRQLSKRGKKTRDLVFGGDYAYWLEGESNADVMRVHRPKDGGPVFMPEQLAKNQSGASSLAADAHGVYWTRKVTGGVAIVMLSL
jgi:serine/threonine protein kinase